MIEYDKFFTERVPVIIHNLALNYTDINAYLTFEDLKRRARNDLFIISRALQRFMLTMAADNINVTSLTVYSRVRWLDNKVKEAFRSADQAETISALADTLRTLDEDFQQNKETFIELIKSHSNTQRYSRYTDITRPRGQLPCNRIPESLMAVNYTGNFINLFVPFDQLDEEYLNSHQMLLTLKQILPIHMYGFGTAGDDWNEQYYKYLEQEWTRCDTRYGTFDATYMTFNSAFNTKVGQYKRVYNYIKPGGTMIIYGLRSDFIPTYLEKLALTLENIRVYCFAHQPSLADDPSCRHDMVLVVGHKASVSDFVPSYRLLLSKFLFGWKDTEPFRFNGSIEDVTPFRTYELTENEYLNLRPALTKTEQGITSFLFPKKERDTRRPLLPFSSGQLGLVLISGDVNGVVEEADTLCRHAVKGFSSRTTSSRTEPVLNTEGLATGHKDITVDYPITNVRIIMPDGKVNKIGGTAS